MLRNVMIASLTAATLAVLSGIAYFTTAAVAEEKKDPDKPSATIRQLEEKIKNQARVIEDLGRKNKTLRDQLAEARKLSRDKRGKWGFNFGGAPKVDSPPVPRDDKDKRALAALAEMAKGKWHLNITTREGRVMRQLIESTGAKRIVEIGTSSGYSTIWLALGARATGGRVYTHEINPKMIELARANFKKAGVDDLITIIKGDAHETVKQHKDTIDVVFLDAEKKGYLDYLIQLLPLVRPGGLILGHDMHVPRPDPRYIKAITTNPNLSTSFIMMESFGIGMTTKNR